MIFHYQNISYLTLREIIGILLLMNLVSNISYKNFSKYLLKTYDVLRKEKKLSTFLTFTEFINDRECY
jgi:hypothetical protein